MHVSTDWDPEAFRKYVIGHARNARVASDQASLAKATGIDSGLLGRYFRGDTQPGITNLEKIHRSVPGTTMQELLVHSGRTAQPAGAAAPLVPRTAHEYAEEVDRLLGDDSPLSEQEQNLLTEMLGRLLEPYGRVRRTA